MSLNFAAISPHPPIIIPEIGKDDLEKAGSTVQAMKKLAFEFYGTSDGRVATISKPKVWDVAPPPPDLYTDDPTLPPGTVKQVDFKSWGAKASFDYKVERDGEILQSRTFYSNFRPWQAVFLRGPSI